MKPRLRAIAACSLLAALALAAPVSPAQAAKPAKAAAKAEPEPAGESVDINGRVTVGLDKVFIKDAEGYILVQGLDLSPYAGRHIAARGIVIRREQEYRVVRLLEYRLQSPDDDSPGAAGAAKAAAARGKK
ncbi:MAG: hypothetical protein HY916_08670 [Desulfovibrio sp.]|jgi:hypothetical protein|nr:hypothetical protein [Desulfovibrio sp.]